MDSALLYLLVRCRTALVHHQKTKELGQQQRDQIRSWVYKLRRLDRMMMTGRVESKSRVQNDPSKRGTTLRIILEDLLRLLWQPLWLSSQSRW
jgi:hypothetical protein